MVKLLAPGIDGLVHVSQISHRRITHAREVLANGQAVEAVVLTVEPERKRIALSYGPEAYVKVSSLFTNGAMQFRYDLDKVMELEARALKTVAPVEVLAGRLDMTMAHDRVAELPLTDPVSRLFQRYVFAGAVEDAMVK